MPGDYVTYTAVVPGQGGARTWHAYSLAIALAPFGHPSGQVARPYPEGRLSLRPGPGSVAIGRRRCAHQPAVEATSAWSLAWPTGLVSLLWACAGADVTASPAESRDKGVVWGLKTDDRNEARPPGDRTAILCPGPGPAAYARETTPPSRRASLLATSGSCRRYPQTRTCHDLRHTGNMLAAPGATWPTTSQRRGPGRGRCAGGGGNGRSGWWR